MLFTFNIRRSLNNGILECRKPVLQMCLTARFCNLRSLLRRKSFIRPHIAAAGRSLAPALHSKAGHRICSRSHEECVLTWLACCDRPQDYSFLVTMGANRVFGLFIDIKALTSNAHFQVDWPTWGINNNWLLRIINYKFWKSTQLLVVIFSYFQYLIQF